MKAGISVIITAFQTQDYIEECLDSVYNQTWFSNNDNWEILLGIDHCEKTLDKIKNIASKYKNLTIIYTTKNVGTYILSNTLISIAKYEHILRFDSDDIMDSHMVEYMMSACSLVKNCSIVQCYFKNFSSTSSVSSKGIAHGIFLCKVDILKKYGGFMPWKCAADSEFLERIKAEKIVKTVIPLILFHRRIHSNSLTRSNETNLQSELRKSYRKYITNMSSTHTVIDMKVADYIEITPDTKITPDTVIKKDYDTKAEEPAINSEVLTAKPVYKNKRIKRNIKIVKKVITGIYSGI